MQTIQSDPSSGQLQGKPIFNDSYKMQRLLGEGLTSKVYLCEELDEPKHRIAVKVLRGEYAQKRRTPRPGKGDRNISSAGGCKRKEKQARKLQERQTSSKPEQSE